MTDQRAAPHDVHAEESLLGAVMLSIAAFEATDGMVDAADFYKPAHGSVFHAIRWLYDTGLPIDSVTVADRLRQDGQLEAIGGPQVLAQIMSSTPATTNARRYAEIVARHSYARRLLTGLQAGVGGLYEGRDPVEVAEQVETGLSAAGTAAVGVPDDLYSLDEWLLEDHRPTPWAVEDLIRIGWRLVIIASEGRGKSVVSRQIALCAANGIHPFNRRPIPAINTLLIDLENPGEAIKETGASITDKLKTLTGSSYREHGCWMWHRPAGIDLRARRDRAELEQVIGHVQPQLICIGPLYRTFTRRGREDHEEVAEQVQSVIDKMRERHQFGIIIEHHAPKGSLGKRDLVPFGSSLWQRWPDLGLTLDKDPDVAGALRIGEYRGARVKATWPDRLDRGEYGWPWTGYYENGMTSVDQQQMPGPFDDPGPGF